MRFVNQVLRTIFYKAAFKKASQIQGNSTGIMALLQKMFGILNREKTNRSLGGVMDQVRLLGDLIKSYASGSYRDISKKNIILILSALVYFVSPLDFIPDFLPVLGFADDIALLTFIYRSVSEELEKFHLWNLNKDLN